MKKTWKIIYYEAEGGKSRIEDFIKALPPRSRAKVMSFIGLLEERGPDLPRPYADLLKDGIHELRIKVTGNQYRFLYFFCFRDCIVLTHAIRKNTDRVPAGEIKAAVGIRCDFLKRYSLKKLQEEFDEDISKAS